MTRPEILAVVPARGGSKSIPRKNLIAVGGKPLIAYSIQQACASRFVTRTIVSTDDAEIAAIARLYGGEVPFMRPAEYAQDMSPDIDVFRHALQWLADHDDYRPELVVHLRPTGPVRRVELIDRAIALMLEHPEADALRSVSTPIQTPYKMWRIEGDYLQPLLTLDGVTEPYCMPRQLLPEVWWQNGYVDIVRPRIILELGLMCGHTVLPFVVDEPILEIDYADSLPLVEDALARLETSNPVQTGGGAKRFPV
jgi:CMP-N,N'-diacetyllegionaminic acid synthase